MHASVTWEWEVTHDDEYVYTPAPFVAPAPPTYPGFVPTRKRSITRDVLSVWKGLKQYQHLMGEYLGWYQFDWVDSTTGPIYDEGPSRRWHPSVQVPALFVLFQQPPNVATEGGRYTVAEFHATLSYDEVRKSGIVNIDTPDQHFGDRIEWNGKLYDLEEYRLQGLMHGQYLTIAIDGHEVKEEELEEDAPIPS